MRFVANAQIKDIAKKKYKNDRSHKPNTVDEMQKVKKSRTPTKFRKSGECGNWTHDLMQSTVLSKRSTTELIPRIGWRMWELNPRPHAINRAKQALYHWANSPMLMRGDAKFSIFDCKEGSVTGSRILNIVCAVSAGQVLEPLCKMHAPRMSWKHHSTASAAQKWSQCLNSG